MPDRIPEYIWVCLKIPCPSREVWLGGMIRGYDSRYDSWVWFVGVIRGPWFSVSLHPPRMVIYPHLPESVSTVGNYTMRGALWSWHAVDAVHAAVRVVCALWSGHRGAVGMPLQGAGAGCCLLSECCVQFGAMLVALRVLLQVLPEGDDWRCCCQSGVCCKPCFGAGMLVSGCEWKVLLEGAVELACWCCCKGWCFRVLQGRYVLYPTRAARVLVKGAAARCRVLLSDFSQKQQEA